MNTMTGIRTWTFTLAAPTIYVPDRKKGQRKPPTGWPKKPAPGWLTMNSSLHRWAAVRLRTQWWAAAMQAAAAAKLPIGVLTRARFDAEVTLLAAARRGEPTNWHPTAKVVVDAVCAGTKTKRGYGLLPDDAPKYLHCPECPHIRFSPQRITPKPFKPLGLLTFTITDLTGEPS